MAVENLKLKGEFIQLNSLLKVMGWAMTGGEANQIIDDGLIKVNGNVELRRRNKIYVGFEVSFGDNTVEIE